jgi:hypothetical protein
MQRRLEAVLLRQHADQISRRIEHRRAGDPVVDQQVHRPVDLHFGRQRDQFTLLI